MLNQSNAGSANPQFFNQKDIQLEDLLNITSQQPQQSTSMLILEREFSKQSNVPGQKSLHNNSLERLLNSFNSQSISLKFNQKQKLRDIIKESFNQELSPISSAQGNSQNNSFQKLINLTESVGQHEHTGHTPSHCAQKHDGESSFARMIDTPQRLDRAATTAEPDQVHPTTSQSPQMRQQIDHADLKKTQPDKSPERTPVSFQQSMLDIATNWSDTRKGKQQEELGPASPRQAPKGIQFAQGASQVLQQDSRS